MRAVALLLAMTILAGGCFPNNARHRTYAKLAEGGALVGGIAMLTVVNTGADCDEDATPGMPNIDCENKASLLSSIGLSLILIGLAGFIVTVSTSPDDKTTTTSTAPPPPPSAPEPPKAEPKKPDAPKPEPKPEPAASSDPPPAGN